MLESSDHLVVDCQKAEADFLRAKAELIVALGSKSPPIIVGKLMEFLYERDKLVHAMERECRSLRSGSA